MEKKKLGLWPTIAILSLFLMNMGTSAVTPAINSISSAFPGVPYTTILYVNTLPSLIGMLATLLSGMLAGRRISYKTLALIGSFSFLAFGTLPAFVHPSFYVILAIRVLFGFGLGLASPVGNAMLIHFFEGEKRANLMGMSAVFINFGGIVLQLMGGALASVHWSYCFFAHLLGIAPFVLVLLFMPKPPLARPQKQAGQSGAKRQRMHPAIWCVCGFFGLVLMLNNPVMVNMSTLVQQRGIGDASVSGIILSAYTLGGMVGGLLFGRIYKAAMRFVAGIGVLVMAVGIGGVLFSHSAPFMVASTFVFGIGFATTMPTVMQVVGLLVTPATAALGSSMVMVFMHLGGFVSVYWVGLLQALTGDAILPPVAAGACVYLVAGILLLLFDPVTRLNVKGKHGGEAQPRDTSGAVEGL